MSGRRLGLREDGLLHRRLDWLVHRLLSRLLDRLQRISHVLLIPGVSRGRHLGPVWLAEGGRVGVCGMVVVGGVGGVVGGTHVVHGGSRVDTRCREGGVRGRAFYVDGGGTSIGTGVGPARRGEGGKRVL